MSIGATIVEYNIPWATLFIEILQVLLGVLLIYAGIVAISLIPEKPLRDSTYKGFTIISFILPLFLILLFLLINPDMIVS